MKSPVLIILAAISGVWSGSFKVTFDKYHCALRGASVVIDCQYDYPFAHIVTWVGWWKQDPSATYWWLVQNPRYRYVGNYKGDCRLQINDVQPTDEGTYHFSFRTTLGSFSSETAQLSVKELTATVDPSTAVEGDSVRLTCTSGCSTPVDVVWTREGWPAKEAFRAKRGDAGGYQCSVWNQRQVKSAPVPLNVLYPPDNVTLSISPGGTVVKGSAVTLSCSSDARPPVEDGGYSLYRERSFIGMGRNHTITDAQPGHNGRYYCQAWNSISSGGAELFHSAALPLRVYYHPVNVSIQMNPARVAWGGGVNLSCSGAADPPVDAYTWYRRTNGSGLLVGSGQVLSIDFMEESMIGPYFCQAWNQVGGGNSTEVMLTMAEEQGRQTLPAVAGVALFFVVALGFVLFLLWFHRKKRSPRHEKGAEGDCGEKQPDTDDLYANVGLGHPLPDSALHSQQPSQPGQDSPTSVEGEVTYSTVNIRSRGLNDRADVHCSWSKVEKNTEQTIYSTVKRS